MTHSIYTCKRSFHILYPPLYSRKTWPILWVLCLSRNMKHRNYSTAYSHSYCIHRLCSTMRTNVILRGKSHYKPSLSNPIHWHYSCRMDLRRLFCRQSNTHAILRSSFYSPLHHYSASSCPPTIFPRNRIQQPHRNPI